MIEQELINVVSTDFISSSYFGFFYFYQ